MGLYEVTTRLDRAQEHLDALNAGIDGFAQQRDPYPFHIVSYYRNEVDRVDWVRTPPAEWSLLVSDCAHNIRCALDHLVYELSGGRGAIVPRYAEFPIFQNEAAFFLRTKKGKPHHLGGLRKIESVTDPEARAAICELQPFRREDPLRNPLWILHELNNFDKHRALPFVFAWIHTNLARQGIRDVSDLPPGWRQARATQSAKRMADIRRLPTGTAVSDVKVRGDLAIRVTLPSKTPGSHECLDVVLAKVIDYVSKDVLDALRRWLPEHTIDYLR